MEMSTIREEGNLAVTSHEQDHPRREEVRSLARQECYHVP
jgi:hypothetical protein